MDRLEGMAVFVKVAELGGFSAAAQAMGLSKSAVSKQVSAMEERLGVRLLNRTTRRLALTEAGEAYRDWCARILQEVEEAELEAGRHGSEPRGRLKVSAPMTFGFLHLSPMIPEFLARHPLVEVDLTLDDRIVDLLAEGFDLALRIGSMRDSSLVARRLATARQVCAASPAYLAARGAPAEPEDLQRHACLRYTYTRAPDLWEFVRGGEVRAVRVHGSFRANNGDALRTAALRGLGVVFLPDFIVGDDLERGALVRLLTAWDTAEVPIQAVWPSQRHLSAKLRAFIDFLGERLPRR
jgi:DNA-binding transcriptional LysR family regulator